MKIIDSIIDWVLCIVLVVGSLLVIGVSIKNTSDYWSKRTAEQNLWRYHHEPKYKKRTSAVKIAVYQKRKKLFRSKKRVDGSLSRERKVERRCIFQRNKHSKNDTANSWRKE